MHKRDALIWQMGRERWSPNWKRFDRLDRHYNVRRPRNDRHGGGLLALASALISADCLSGRTGSAPGAADATEPCASKAYRRRCAISSSSMSGATGPCLVRNTTRRSPTSGQAAGSIAHNVHAITAEETAVEPTQHGARLRNTRGYRSYSARVGDGRSQSHIDHSAPRARRTRADAAGSGSEKARPEILKQERAFRSQIM